MQGIVRHFFPLESYKITLKPTAKGVMFKEAEFGTKNPLFVKLCVFFVNFVLRIF